MDCGLRHRHVSTLVAVTLLCFTALSHADIRANFEAKKQVILNLIAVAENSRPYPEWTYAEMLTTDNRGITFGPVGFCTGTCDGIEVIQYIQKKNAAHPLAKFYAGFKSINDSLKNCEGSRVMKNLDAPAFIEAWSKPENLKDALFMEANRAIMDKMYWKPALDWAIKLKVQLPLTMAQIMDTAIRHGIDGTNGLEDVINSMGTLKSGPAIPGNVESEKAWLTAFLSKRLVALKGLGDNGEDTCRVDMCKTLMTTTQGLQLQTPFKIHCYEGDSDMEITAVDALMPSDEAKRKEWISGASSGTGGQSGCAEGDENCGGDDECDDDDEECKKGDDECDDDDEECKKGEDECDEDDEECEEEDDEEDDDRWGANADAEAAKAKKSMYIGVGAAAGGAAVFGAIFFVARRWIKRKNEQASTQEKGKECIQNTTVPPITISTQSVKASSAPRRSTLAAPPPVEQETFA